LIRQFCNFYTAKKPEMIKLQSFQMQFEFAKVELRVQFEGGEETHKPVYKFYIIFQSIIVVDFSFSTVHNTEKKKSRDLDPPIESLKQ
jgi:hypothetical protein